MPKDTRSKKVNGGGLFRLFKKENEQETQKFIELTKNSIQEMVTKFERNPSKYYDYNLFIILANSFNEIINDKNINIPMDIQDVLNDMVTQLNEDFYTLYLCKKGPDFICIQKYSFYKMTLFPYTNNNKTILKGLIQTQTTIPYGFKNTGQTTNVTEIIFEPNNNFEKLQEELYKNFYNNHLVRLKNIYGIDTQVQRPSSLSNEYPLGSSETISNVYPMKKNNLLPPGIGGKKTKKLENNKSIK